MNQTQPNSLISDLVAGGRPASFCSQGSSYQVETRARVIMFDIASFEALKALQRRSSSKASHSADHPSRTLSREHGGLMSWPEDLYMPMQHHHNPKETDHKGNHLSARAMQLSKFGSMVTLSFLLFRC